MIVYGELERTEHARDVKASVLRALSELENLAPGKRHSALLAAFIRLAELVEGIADAEFNLRGYDDRSEDQQLGAALLLQAARLVDHSWRGRVVEAADLRPIMKQLQAISHEGVIRLRLAEGYAHYALYPESYLEAARHSGLDSSTCVIGIRSIGVGLAALVAAALGAGPAISLRPVGHPFRREIRADPRLFASALKDPEMRFAIVDEGPGQSGSSFASVAAYLQQLGVSNDRITFFPSHDGSPGVEASDEVRAIWGGIERFPASDHDVITSPNGLHSWLEPCVGSGEFYELAGEAMDYRFARRRFLVQSVTGKWVAKFAGLGAVGERKHRDAVALAQAGFGAPVAGLCNGFLVQRWLEGRPVRLTAENRGVFLERVASYLAFRATHLGPAGPGASLGALREMAVHNTREALGEEAAATLHERLAHLPELEGKVRRIRTDNRLHLWEWLEVDGAFVKLDAVDHCEAHDLIGCQDIAWDVAGAMTEFRLNEKETDELVNRIESAGVSVNRRLLDGLVPCYLAFQLGLWSTATPGSDSTRTIADKYISLSNNYRYATFGLAEGCSA